MCSKIANVVFVMVGYTVALTGLGCGKSCTDVTKDAVEAQLACITKTPGDSNAANCCAKAVYQTAVDEKACDGTLQTSLESLLASYTTACK